jgi:hypothetical protein
MMLLRITNAPTQGAIAALMTAFEIGLLLNISLGNGTIELMRHCNAWVIAHARGEASDAFECHLGIDGTMGERRACPPSYSPCLNFHIAYAVPVICHEFT